MFFLSIDSKLYKQILIKQTYVDINIHSGYFMCKAASYMRLCVQGLDSRMDHSKTGKFLPQNTGWSLLHVKWFQYIGNLEKQNKRTKHRVKREVVNIWWMTPRNYRQSSVFTQYVHHRHHHPDLFIVGHCLDMRSCCDQSHVSWWNLGWQLSVKVNFQYTWCTLE